MTEDGRRGSEDTQWTVNTHRKFNFVVKCNFFCRNVLQVAVQFLKCECRCRFHFFLCRSRNLAWAACCSLQFQLLYVAVSELCRLSEFTLQGPLKLKNEFVLVMWFMSHYSIVVVQLTCVVSLYRKLIVIALYNNFCMNWQEVFRIWLKNYKNDVIPVQIYIYFAIVLTHELTRSY